MDSSGRHRSDTENRPADPRPAPNRPQAEVPRPDAVPGVRQRVADAMQRSAAARPPSVPEPAPNAPAGRLKRLYDVWAMPVGFSIRLKANGYMDLVIEKLQRDRVSLTHYGGPVNGDLMKDPDCEVLLLSDGTVRGITYQNDYVAVYHSAEDLPPTSKLALSIHEFVSDWLKELHAQGFSRPSPEEAQRRAETLAAYLRDTR